MGVIVHVLIVNYLNHDPAKTVAVATISSTNLDWDVTVASQ